MWTVTGKYCFIRFGDAPPKIHLLTKKIKGEFMDKTTKALFVACFVLATALGFTTGPLLQEKPILPSKTTKNTTITNNPNKTTSNLNNTNQDKEDLVTFPSGYLIHVGEAHPICPFCGSTDTYQTGTGPVGDYWYYYYHCNSCGRDFAEYTENVFT